MSPRIKKQLGDFSGGLVVKTLPSNAGGVGLIPGKGELRFHMPHSQKTKTQNPEVVLWQIQYRLKKNFFLKQLRDLALRL